jgi:hypothetical protein
MDRAGFEIANQFQDTAGILPKFTRAAHHGFNFFFQDTPAFVRQRQAAMTPAPVHPGGRDGRELEHGHHGVFLRNWTPNFFMARRNRGGALVSISTDPSGSTNSQPCFSP